MLKKYVAFVAAVAVSFIGYTLGVQQSPAVLSEAQVFATPITPEPIASPETTPTTENNKAEVEEVVSVDDGSDSTEIKD